MAFDQSAAVMMLTAGSVVAGTAAARLRWTAGRGYSALVGLACGVLLFLAWDSLSDAVAPLDVALRAAADGRGWWSEFGLDAEIVGGSLMLGLLSARWWLGRVQAASGMADPRPLALTAALAIGAHTGAEGLALGHATATGALTVSLGLAVALALHGVVEGLGMAGVIGIGGARASTWLWLGLLPAATTLAGGLAGYLVFSPLVLLAILGVGLGALAYVALRTFRIARLGDPRPIGAGLVTGLIVAFGTEVLVALQGA